MTTNARPVHSFRPDDVPTTLYARLRDRLRADILDGRLKTSEKLPSEHELTALHGVSRITVRQALNDLQKQGLIVKLHGKGAFVAPRRVSATLDRVEGLQEAMAAGGHAIQNRRLALSRARATREVARELALKPGTEIIALDTLRYLDGVPLSVNRTWIPLAVGLRLARMDLSDRDLVEVYERDFGTRVASACIEVRARHPTSRQAKLLRVAADLPCLQVHRVLLTSDDIPLHYEIALYRGDTYSHRSNPRRSSAPD